MRWMLFIVLVLTCLTEWTLGQTLYDAKKFYQPMTDDYDVRQGGTLFLPTCMKNLMNCWELIRPDLVCKYRNGIRLALESMCMDLRMNCVDQTGPEPVKSIKMLSVLPWNYCPVKEREATRMPFVGPNYKGHPETMLYRPT